MGSDAARGDPPERPARKGEPLWVDPDWWRSVLRPDGTPADPLTAPLPPPTAEPTLVEPVPGPDDVPSAGELLAAPATAPRSGPGIDVGAPLVEAPPVATGPVPTAVPLDPPGLPEGGAPAAPDLLADPQAAPPPKGTATPLASAAGLGGPTARPGSSPLLPPALPERRELHVPRVDPSPTGAAARPPSAPPRRAVANAVRSRAADVGLVLLALAVVLLVYLALTR